MKKNELIRKWDAALRSGKYRQERGGLRYNHPSDGSKFCCLGVLCDAAGEQWEDTGHGNARVDADGTNPYLFLPRSLSDIIGACNPDLVVTEGENMGLRTTARATELNDTHGMSFVEIADCIRRTWPEAFPGQPLPPQADG